MDVNLATKLNLLNYIRVFSMPDFPDFHIFSKTFFHDLFIKLYENNGTYTMLYGDIDGLRKLNDKIGFDNANLAIKELLKTIFQHLPENVIACRLGGDEFCFTIQDLSLEETRKLTKKIHGDLSTNDKVMGLDITFGACDSTQFDNINDMYEYVENRVEEKKLARFKLKEDLKNTDDFNNKLDDLIDFTLKLYLNNFRFSSERTFSREDLKTLSLPILNTITNLLNDENTINIKSNPESDLENLEPEINIDTATKIYHLIMDGYINYDYLNSISIRDLKSVKNSLSTDSVTGTYNNVYRDHYLFPRLQESDSSFQVLLVESLGIKISNSVLSHTGTDKKISSTYENFITEFNNIIPEKSNIKITPIHSGGGTFEIIIENNDGTITYDSIQKVLEKVNSNKDNFQLFGMLGNCADISSYETVYSKLIRICEKQKNLVKDNPDYFVYDENTYNLISISLESVVNFFKTQAKKFGIYNEEEKIKFTKKIINSLIDNFNLLNLSNTQKEDENMLK